MRKLFVGGLVLCLGLIGAVFPISAGGPPPIDNPLVIGLGNLVDAAWSDSGDYFAVSTTGGVILYDNILDQSQYLTDKGELGGRLAWQPDGLLLAMSGGYDAQLRRIGHIIYVFQLINDAPTGDLVMSDVIFSAPLDEGTANTNAIWSPDGSQIVFPVMDFDANAGLALYLRVLDVETADYHDSDIRELMLDDVTGWAWTDDGAGIIAILQGGIEQVILDPVTGDEISRETIAVSSDDPVSSPDGNSTATFTDDGGVLVTTPDQEFTLRPRGESSRFIRFRDIEWSQNSEYVTVIGTRTEPNVLVANTQTGEIILDLTYDQRGIVRDVLFQPHGDAVIVTTIYRDIYLYDLTTGNLIAQRWLHGGGTGITLSPDGTQVASTTAYSQNIYIRDTHTSDELRMLESPNGVDSYNPIFVVAWSPDGHYIATGARRNSHESNATESGPIDVFIWDAETGEVVQTVPAVAYVADYIIELEWSADSRVIAWTTLSNETAQSHVGAWDVENETLLYQQALEAGVLDIALHPAGNILSLMAYDYSQGNSASLEMIDLTSGEITSSTPLDADQTYGIEWHPDGEYLALLERSINYDTTGRVTVFQPEGNAEFSMDITDAITLSGLPDLVWNPDGTRLAFNYVVEVDNSGTTYGVMILDVSLEMQEITIHEQVERESSLGYGPNFPPIAWSGDGTRIAVSALSDESLIIQVGP